MKHMKHTAISCEAFATNESRKVGQVLGEDCGIKEGIFKVGDITA